MSILIIHQEVWGRSGILRVQHLPLTLDDPANVVKLFSGAVE